MTALASESADWSFLADEKVMRVVDAAAAIVSAKHGDRAVASLAERDDLRQEALIILATRGCDSSLDEGVLRHRLVFDLLNLTERGFRNAIKSRALEAVRESEG